MTLAQKTRPRSQSRVTASPRKPSARSRTRWPKLPKAFPFVLTDEDLSKLWKRTDPSSVATRITLAWLKFHPEEIVEKLRTIEDDMGERVFNLIGEAVKDAEAMLQIIKCAEARVLIAGNELLRRESQEARS